MLVTIITPWVPKHELADYLVRIPMYRSQFFPNASLVMAVCDPNLCCMFPELGVEFCQVPLLVSQDCANVDLAVSSLLCTLFISKAVAKQHVNGSKRSTSCGKEKKSPLGACWFPCPSDHSHTHWCLNCHCPCQRRLPALSSLPSGWCAHALTV